MALQTVKWERDSNRSGPSAALYASFVTVTLTLASTPYTTGGLHLTEDGAAGVGGRLRQAGLGNVRRVEGFEGWVLGTAGVYSPAIIDISDPIKPRLKLLIGVGGAAAAFEEIANGTDLGTGSIVLKFTAHGQMA